MKKVLLIAIILFSVAVFAACGKAKNTTNVTGQNSSTTSASTTTHKAAVTTQETSGTTSDEIVIAENGTLYFTLIRPELASNDEKQAVVSMKRALVESGFEAQISEDWISPREDRTVYENALEILVGECDREKTKAYQPELRYYDYAIKADGNKILIKGGSETALIEAVEYFTGEYINGKERIAVPSDLEYIVNRQYSKQSLTINGNKISDYTIVYDRKFEATAKALAIDLGKSTGAVIKTVKSDAKESAYEILIGDTERKESTDATPKDSDGLIVKLDGSKLVIKTTSTFAMNKAYSSVLAKITEADNVTSAIDFETSYAADYILNVLDYNVRYDSLTNDPTADTALTDFIKEQDFDIVSMQEVKKDWNNALGKKIGDTYGSIITYRNNANGDESNPIYYKKSKFKLLDSGTFWLAEGAPTMPKKGWDALLNRIVTWGYFRIIGTDETIMIVNTHFDHKGELAKINSAKLVSEKIDEYSKRTKNIILTGDFNMRANSSEGYKILDQNENLALASNLRETFKYGDGKSAIDMIFVNDNVMRVYCVSNEYIAKTNVSVKDSLRSDGTTPVGSDSISDHMAIWAKIGIYFDK